MKRNLLITGVSGLLGSNLARHFAEKCRVVGVYHENAPSIDGIQLIQQDLSREDACDRGDLAEYSPDNIIHCAGEANVDDCERDPAHAEKHILQIAKSVARYAKKHGAHLVSISTDAVSDGSTEYLSEDDALNPLNVYGRVKVRTEDYLTSEHPSAMVVRTRFYGTNIVEKKCFTEHILTELSSGREVRCFTDNYCCQIYVMNLAEILEECMASGMSGIFNIVEDKKYSRFEYAQTVARVFGLDESLLVPCSMSDMHFVAPRPFDTSLSNSKIKAHIETEILPAEQALARMKKDMRRCN